MRLRLNYRQKGPNSHQSCDKSSAALFSKTCFDNRRYLAAAMCPSRILMYFSKHLIHVHHRVSCDVYYYFNPKMMQTPHRTLVPVSNLLVILGRNPRQEIE